MNPVLWRELRVMARRPRMAWTITIGLWSCLAMVWIFAGQMSLLVAGAGGVTRVGRVLVGALIVTLATVIALVAPFVAARAVSLERRRQTFDLLIITPLPARAILRGKLLGSLMPLFVMLGATLPLAMLLRLYGGFSALQVLVAYVFLFQETLVFGLLGCAAALFSGDRHRRGQLGLFAALAFLLVGTPLADMYARTGLLWWVKLPVVLAVLLWLVADTARRISRRGWEAESQASDLRQMLVFMFFALLLSVGLGWDIYLSGGPTLRYLNPLLAVVSVTGVPLGVEPAPFNFSVSFCLYLVLPGAAFPPIANRLQSYFNTSFPNERGIFF